MQTRIERLKYELGDALVRFSHLEWIVTFTASALMSDVVDVCVGILGELSFRKKVDVLAALVRSRSLPAEIAARAEVALKLVYRSEEGRNRIVHSTWTVGSEKEDSVFRLKPTVRGKTGFDFGFRQITEDEIEDVILSIREAITALGGCIESFQEKNLLRFNIVKKEPNQPPACGAIAGEG